jgi:hypothetical protein
MSKGSNTIKNCYIGTDATGSYDAGNNAKGIILQSSYNTIGGTASTDKVVISGNNNGGIQFYTSAASYNKMLGCYVGTDATGTKAIPNINSGVAIRQAHHNTIGGTTAGSRNVISGNGTNGIVVNGGGANYNTILGNYIGTNASGTARLGNNHYGIEISEPNNTVGGTTSGARNVISGNKWTGVVLWLASGSNNKVQGNYIGTDHTGMYDLGNYWRGIDITNGSSNNTIGGSGAARNVLSGNEHDGVRVYQGSNNTISYNYIGFAANGSKALGNAGDGVRLPSARTVRINYNKIGNNGTAAVNATTSSGCSMTGNTIVNDHLVNIKNTGGSVVVSPTPTPTPTPSDTTKPYVTGKGADKGYVWVSFSENVLASLSSGDLVLKNNSTGATISGLSYKTGNGYSGVWWWPNHNGGTLAKGSYTATIAAGNVKDAAGNTLPSNWSTTFTV